MNRDEMLSRLGETEIWDIVVIGGGATGLGNIKLVREALRERGLLLRNAPHLTRTQPFIVPSYHWWEKWYYGVGLKVYDLLAGKLGLGKTGFLSAAELLQRIPVAEKKNLSGGVSYFDGQFDDARLAIHMAMTAAEQGAVVLNYMEVSGMRKEGKKISGVEARDMVNDRSYFFQAKAVVNATGVYVDEVLRMEDPQSPGMVAPSQGVHIVLSKKFFPTATALMIPKTSDKRVLFAVPWNNHVVVGTTDTPVDSVDAEPLPFREEISFIIYHFNKYLTSDIRESDIRSIFTGLRPLVKSGNTGNTAILSRDHTIVVSPSGLVTITGGKWTTYRKMAKPCATDELRLHGWVAEVDPTDPLHHYGTDASKIRARWRADPATASTLHPDFPYTWAELDLAVEEEMAMTVEDMLARRMRILFLDARAAIDLAPSVARRMAGLLNRNEAWIDQQVISFTQTAGGYLP
jgi:glycerol-3-phosphate dehydrogenase